MVNITKTFEDLVDKQSDIYPVMIGVLRALIEARAVYEELDQAFEQYDEFKKRFLVEHTDGNKE